MDKAAEVRAELLSKPTQTDEVVIGVHELRDAMKERLEAGDELRHIGWEMTIYSTFRAYIFQSGYRVLLLTKHERMH